MVKLRALILVSCFIGSPLTTTAQKGTGTLQLGTPVERQLGPGQSHDFTATLEENNLLQLVVEQQGIDVIVKVFSPSGKTIGEFDSANGTDGPEHVSFVSAAAGTYRIAVSPLDPWDTTTGRYQIKLLEIRPANDQELKASKNLAAVKAKGIALINDIAELTSQIKSPQIRIRTQIWAGNLFWETDEKLATKFFSDAVSGLKEFLASLEDDDEYWQPYSATSQLRYEVVQILAQRNPEMALNLLHATRMSERAANPREQAIQESAAELSIAEQMARKDPARALKLARQSLKKALSPNLVNTLRQLQQQNPEMAVELGGEIATRLSNEKLLKSTEVASLATGLAQIYRRSRITFNGNVHGTFESPSTPLLRDDQYRELVQKMLTEALSYSRPERVDSHTPERDAAWSLLHGLQAMGPSLDTIVPGGEAAVRKKLAEMNASNTANVNIEQQLQNTIANSSADASLDSIAKAPPESREQYYVQLANHLANTGDMDRAKQIINDHVSNPFQRRQSLNNFERQKIYHATNKGKVEEALRVVNTFRNPRERAQHLVQVLNQISQGQKRATALKLLEQARGMLSPSDQAQDQEQMAALLELARAFSRYDPKRAFEILEPLIDQFNELSAAARALDGFGYEAFEDGELVLHNGGSVANVAGNLSKVVAMLALIDFDQAKAASDRIRLPEVRVRAYLDIAEQALQAAK